MNAIVPTSFDKSVPAYLRLSAFLQVNQAAAAGVSTFQAPHRISIRASRFHYVDPEGVETDVAENHGVALDVVIVDANPTLSKMYYSKPYNASATEPVAPDCMSDNGVAPSERAAAPQAATCGACPHGAWGSKIGPNGQKLKACSDSKKLAVVPISNPTGPVFLLTVPAASMAALAAVADTLQKRGVPLGALVVQLGFDPAASFPKITFAPQRWLSEQESAAVVKHPGSDEVAEIVGKNDKPRAALAAPAEQPNSLRLEPAVPQPVAPVAAPQAAIFSEIATAMEAAPRRTRRTRAEMDAARAAPPAPPPAQAAPEVPAFLANGNGAAPASAPTMQPASADLDSMLDGIMGNK